MAPKTNINSGVEHGFLKGTRTPWHCGGIMNGAMMHGAIINGTKNQHQFWCTGAIYYPVFPNQPAANHRAWPNQPARIRYLFVGE